MKRKVKALAKKVLPRRLIEGMRSSRRPRKGECCLFPGQGVFAKGRMDSPQAVGSRRFLFVCGLHRSGTSLLSHTLSTHPLISGFHNTGVSEDEGQHLQSLFPPAKFYGGPGKFGFAPEAHLTETSDLVTADNAAKLFLEWSRYWDLSKPLLLEKSPPNLIRTRFLQAMFPHSYFIVIIRHPIAVALATRKWSRSRLDSLISHWVTCHHIFDLDRVHVKNLYVINYELLVSCPTETFTSVCKFLNISHELQVPRVDSRVNERYFEIWSDMRRDPAAANMVSLIERRYGKAIRSYGYRLDNLDQLVFPEAAKSDLR